MTRRMAMAACAALLLGGSALANDNNNGDWVKLGSVNAGHDADHDRITVSGPHDEFRKLKFKVKNAGLNMHQVVVTYDDGAPERLEVKENLSAGSETRAIDLHGGKRSIRTIEFWYETKGNKGDKAEVVAFGQR